MTADEDVEVNPIGASVPALTGAEHFIVGLSPSYWAHVPLLVAQILDLRVVGGILCLDQPGGSGKLVPVTKCSLVGVIVAVDARYESTVYVIDDGTGLIDCVHWTDHSALMLTDIIAGPMSSSEDPHLRRLGETVRVYGRIVHCYSLSDDDGPGGASDADGASNSRNVREIRATLVEPVTVRAEIEHWNRCTTDVPSLNNAIDVLKQLGPRIGAHLMDPSNLPMEDDDGAWRLFGIRCRCKLPYKDELLYCHCHATPELLDPGFKFRDSLLEELIRLESSAPEHQELRFQFHSLKQNERIQQSLAQVAMESLSDDHEHQPCTLSLIKDRLFRGTFHALRNDGIVYLVHPPSDTYIFISFNRVLKSDCRRRPPPEYFARVPKARLELVRRRLARIISEMGMEEQR